MHNTLVDMLRDRGYKIEKGSEYNKEKFNSPGNWIMKGSHYVKRDFNQKIYVYYIYSSKQAEDVIKDLNSCRVLIIFAEGVNGRLDKAK